MASSSSPINRQPNESDLDEEEDDQNPNELECFDDFTVASSWERLISDVEAVCRQWMADGPINLKEKGAEFLDSRRNLYKVKRELKYSMKLYCMEYYFEVFKDDKTEPWDDDLHKIQLSFGVSQFLVIAPLSASGVVLDAPESSKLLSAVATALSNCGSNWPAFVPVHDPSRKAYIGIQNMGTTFTRRFDSDRIGSQVPVRLMHMEGLYELFVSKFALSSIDFSTTFIEVHCTMKLTYRTPPYDEDDDGDGENLETEDKESKGDTDGINHIVSQWDDDYPWAEWYSAEDPVKGFELTAIWPSKIFEGSLEMAELENASSFDAEKWLIYLIVSPNMIDDSLGKLTGFASQLYLLVGALDKSFEALFLEDFTSAENMGSDNSKSTSSVPPPTAVDRILKELFHEGGQSSNYVQLEHKKSRVIKGAPLDSLFAQFCLHAMWFGNCNIRAIATLWIEFVREVRWCWEESQPLPRMSTDSSIDLSTCLVHQKLQMKKGLLDNFHSSNKSKGQISDENKSDFQNAGNHCHDPVHEHSPDDKNCSYLIPNGHDGTENATVSVNPSHGIASDEQRNVNTSRRGSARILESSTLLHSFQKMHAPYTQEAPPMTEDMHEERLRAVEAFGDAFSVSGQLERDILSSDMSAFKAANPDALFEDFIRWHSPTDWENDETGDRLRDDKMEGDNSWPPRGRLSQRMSEQGNSWRKIWNDSPALPVSEQKPLFDPIREGEKILHYLETLKPQQLLEQMVTTAFRASADTLNQTAFGDWKLMKTKLDQLYLTLASTLKCFQGNHSLEKSELIGDLFQLCRVFEHIEKLLILAASVRRKLLDAPRLSEAIFNDYFNYYLPKMGTSSASICYDKEFNTKQLVKLRERDAVASLFPPPTANQSWRKVLSMGNLLNGHEPALREIIFSVYDTLSDNHYGSSNSSDITGDIETHRMYICGTSNDLQVALSVTSWD
ncbi:rab3 GTPase-activating protein catalytic subunit isoform X2 [Asparagus officinalis]|uniref:rab3 GTPase-activating protein catalytic subunit isoform X2 n=1 Tax=Asparagus officinalis TaxID=4686 RepID=UPI00098E7256|nr:rab3 GTPase-activating protein catalytic subunit isoform X2 [Asparagus officinalis]